MPEQGSAAKRHRQSEKRRQRNKIVKSRVRSSMRKLLTMVESGSKEDAQNQLKEVSSLLDRAVSKGVIHINTAARRKHRLNKSIKNLS